MKSKNKDLYIYRKYFINKDAAQVAIVTNR